MSEFINPIMTACYAFPILAAVFTIPYIIHEYHKYGSILIFRTGIVYTFVFYLMTSFFMTVLPLPPIDSVTPHTAGVFLKPFGAVKRWIDASGFDIGNYHTYKKALKNKELWQMIFNVILLFPLGVYLRYYFKRKWWQVLILSFLYSLFFEITQITGIYGIYPYPYRYFDVDDLICNTLGGILGFAATPLFCFFLPKRDRLDAYAYIKGKHISMFRRITGSTIDIFVFLLLGFIGAYFMGMGMPGDIWCVVVIPPYIWLMMTFFTSVFRGKTLGKFLVNIQLRDVNGHRAHSWQFMLRYFILYVLCIPSALYTYVFYRHARMTASHTKMLIGYGIGTFCAVIFVVFVTDMIVCLASGKQKPLYDKWCNTVNVSCVKRKR